MVVHPDGQPRAATELCPAHASWPVGERWIIWPPSQTSNWILGSGRCAKYLLERWHHYQYGSDPLRTDSDRLTPEK